MNQANFKKLIDKYIEKLVVTNDENHDEVFKWIACLQFKKLDLETEDFMVNFNEASKEASVLLDNGWVYPRSGILKLGEYEPDKVKQLFTEDCRN